MRRLLQASILTLITLLIVVFANAQTIRIADNNVNKPTGANIYPTLQAAIDAAVSGDIVYVQPSTTSYGDVTINKKIILRGIGFNTGKDIALGSIVGNIAMTITVDGTSNASGSTIEGIQGNDIYLGTPTGAFTYTLKDVVITNCLLNRVYREPSGYQPIQNFTLKNCQTQIEFRRANVSSSLIYGNYLIGNIYFSANECNSSIAGLIISNNIFSQNTNITFSNTAGISSLLITNNVFLSGSNVAGAHFLSNISCNAVLSDAVVTNNIFYGVMPGSNGGFFERNAFYNNLSYGTTNDVFPPAGTGVGNTGSNNIASTDPKFVNVPFNTNYDYSFNFQLQSGSPAKNAGSDGTDIGITGGAYASTSGMFGLRPTSTPVIMTLNPSGIVPQGQPVKTSIKAKSY